MFDIPLKNHDEFYHTILSQSIAALKINTFMDNFDEKHFNSDGVDRSKIFNSDMCTFYFDWFFKKSHELWNVYSILDDEISKSLYANLIAFRLGSHFSIRIPVGFIHRTNELMEYRNAIKSTESQIDTKGLYGKLKHFDFYYQGKHYQYDGVDLESYLFRNQYFYERFGKSIKPEPGDHIIDGGACLGDTALVFSNQVGEQGMVYSFDPVQENLNILKYNIEQFPIKNVQAIPFGLSNKEFICDPTPLGSYDPGFRVFNAPTPLQKLDSLVQQGVISKINYIKLDVEGSEKDAIEGAIQSILHFKPKLAISLYHNPDDLFTIPIFIKKYFPFYELHLDHYTIHNDETVLYCIPKA